MLKQHLNQCYLCFRKNLPNSCYLEKDLCFDGMFQDNGYAVANEDIVVYEKTNF